jgi:macrodomain Ter protein organizer (MatP/YcbG family)
MSQAGEYRRKAAECQQQAKKSITPLDIQHWLRLAAYWLKMAEVVDDEIDY